MNKKELWKKILDIAITILTAIATSLTTTSCMGVM
ncbi:MAG: smalltalk protein [Bacteroides sp.]|nr:smalltalk protein [Bacteroides sp.]